jgi:hypothetical protein
VKHLISYFWIKNVVRKGLLCNKYRIPELWVFKCLERVKGERFMRIEGKPEYILSCLFHTQDQYM